MNVLEITHRWANIQSSQGYNYLYPANPENLVLVWLDAGKSSGSPAILNRVLELDKKRSNKRIDSALGHLKQLGLTDEQTSRLLETLKNCAGITAVVEVGLTGVRSGKS